jgi:D-3-phosphoglycerate dehydrogenase
MNLNNRYRGELTEEGIQSMRVALCDGIHTDVEKALAKEGVRIVDPTEARVMMIRSKTELKTSEVFQQHPHLMIVIRAGVGFDNINIQEAREAGVATVTTPGASSEAVARRAKLFIEKWAAREHIASRVLREGRWPKGQKDMEPIALQEKVLGIVGYGRIGQALESQLIGQFHKVLRADVQRVPRTIPLQDLLAEADVISIHVSGDAEILTPELLALVKPGALIVNTARGGVVNVEGLFQAMERGVEYAADVFPDEGKNMFTKNPRLLDCLSHPKLVAATPHTAASDKETQRQLGLEGADLVLQFMNTGTLNPQDLPGHSLGKLVIPEPSNQVIRTVLTHTASDAASLNAMLQQASIDPAALHSATRDSLTVTAFDQEPDAQRAYRVLHTIQSQVRVLRHRLFVHDGVLKYF